jgi:hypothetical protein
MGVCVQERRKRERERDNGEIKKVSSREKGRQVAKREEGGKLN